jgi:Mg2+-importing ATPase
MRHWFEDWIAKSGQLRWLRWQLWQNAYLTSAKEKAKHISPSLKRAARDDLDLLQVRLQSQPYGLTSEQAAQARKKFGSNEHTQSHHWRWARSLWSSYVHPFNLLLTLIGSLSWLQGEQAVTTIIFVMVSIATSLRWFQEIQSSKTIESLEQMVQHHITVLRPQDRQANTTAFEQTVPTHALVPGDVVVLIPGDWVPADCRLITATNLYINQSTLSGESLPVRKQALLQGAGGDDLLALDHMVYQGTTVVSGSAKAMVVATGRHTVFGQISASIHRQRRQATAFEIGSDQVSWLMVHFALVLLALVLLISGIRTGEWGAALLFAMAVAVGLTPELLPMIVSATLARGAKILSRHQIIIRRLDAVQNLGAMDMLCADKTGTLTSGLMQVQGGLDAHGQPNDLPLYWATCHAQLQSGTCHLIDQTLVNHSEAQALLQQYGTPQKINELPFDAETRRAYMAFQHNDGKRWICCKGSVEDVLAICDTFENNGAPLVWDWNHRRILRTLTKNWSLQGLRVIAIARQELSEEAVTTIDPSAKGYTLLGFVVFADPLKLGAREAIAHLSHGGIGIKILTGDNEWVTQSVCEQLGLEIQGITTGKRINRMSDDQLERVCRHTTIFARLTPLQKQRVVSMLRQQGHVVGYMGDGINDAPALASCDVGISFKTAVDAAREVADVVLLQRDLRVLHEGVTQGRTTFVNIIKYIRMATSSNVGNAMSVVTASALLPFLPILPLQLLAQNLLYSLSQLAIPFDRVEPALIQKPVRWNASGIGSFMLTFGPLSSVFDLLTFAFLWWGLGLVMLGDSPVFHAGWFTVGLLSQLMVVHIIRTPERPIIDSRPSMALVLASLSSAVIGLWLVLGPLSTQLEFGSLPASYALWVAGLLVAYALAAQGLKRWYSQRFGWL